jgi:hypothetical protein
VFRLHFSPSLGCLAGSRIYTGQSSIDRMISHALPALLFHHRACFDPSYGRKFIQIFGHDRYALCILFFYCLSLALRWRAGQPFLHLAYRSWVDLFICQYVRDRTIIILSLGNTNACPWALCIMHNVLFFLLLALLRWAGQRVHFAYRSWANLFYMLISNRSMFFQELLWILVGISLVITELIKAILFY